MTLVRVRVLVVALLAVGMPGRVAGQTPAYRLERRIEIGGEGGWDYLAVDTVAHRLYVSHGTRVEVVDLDSGTVVGQIPNTLGVHGIAVAPELGRGFTSNGRDSSVTIFDLRTLAVIANVKVGARNPDAIIYEPTTRHVFTMNGGSASVTAIDAATGAVLGSVDVGGKPEFVVADRGRLYVNIEDRGTIVSIDAATLRASAPWPIAPCEEPTGLAIDRRHRRLFSVCGNRMMAVVDADDGRVITTVPIGQGVDGVMFDPSSQLAFSSNGEGTVTVVHEDAPDRYSVVGNVETQRGARTLALDARTHRLYLSTAQFGPPPPPTPERPNPRPTVVPGSFVVLVLAPTQ